MIEDKLSKLQNKIKNISANLETEESTKTALVLPFIQMLGYDIFDPTQVLPEYNCDLVKNKGEKVDYALLIKNKIEIIIEYKGFNVDLTPHRNQLSRYFVSTKANFAVLTNGVTYQFYTDLDNKNLMDDYPFFQISLNSYTPADVEVLEQFSLCNFSAENINQKAADSKIITGITEEVKMMFEKPSLDIIKLCTKSVYKGRYTEAVTTKLTNLFKKALKQYVNDCVSGQLREAVEAEESGTTKESKVVTTEEEKQAFYIIQSIARNIIPSADIVMRDQISKCCVLYKNNMVTPIVKLYFNDLKSLKIELFDKEKPHKVNLNNVDEIYDYEDSILETCKKYAPQTTNKGKKAANFKFSMLDIASGEYVTFVPTGAQCIVVDDKTISYNDEEYSLSGFCVTFMPDNMRNAAESYQGPKYFAYNGKSLVDLRNELGV